MDQHEQFFTCPYCAQKISMLIDLSVPAQTYIEDCEICCRPIEISYQVSDDDVVFFEARSS
ncbi:MAG: CPXCG motif-containing cysteine-rich protein [Nitrospinae bacterium]|nr:CPXCG motif-containing cysteine-rich protein [Nitrospinota bacterium]